MKPIIYYRKSLFDQDEFDAASKYFDCVDLLTDITPNSLVIGRYSLFPFFNDQEREILNKQSKLINNSAQYSYIADLKNYVYDLKELTPQTWFDLTDLPNEGPFIVKGATNSKKNKFNELMFAKNKQEAFYIQGRLQEDGLIGYQNIYFRKYEPLISYATGIGGIPISKEFRFFVLYGKIISGAFYWSNYSDNINVPSVSEVPQEFLNEVIKRIGNNSNFYVIDVAQKQNKEWIVIELNEGQQSGLSDNNPDLFYKNLKENLI